MLRKKINKERLAQSFSVYKLAKLAGLQITQLNQFLKGFKTLNSDNIEKLFEVLKININYINIINELDILIDSHYSNEIDSRDEWLREVIDLKNRLSKNCV